MENISSSKCDLEQCLGICVDVLDRFAPCKKSLSDTITSSSWIEILKAHLKRNHLQNQIQKNRFSTNKTTYNKCKTNACIFWKKKTNLKGKNARDNKQFWRNVKPLLSEMLLVEGNKIISQGEKMQKFWTNFSIIQLKTWKIRSSG